MIIDNEKDYDKNFKAYSEFVKSYSVDQIYPHTIECSFESLSDWSSFYNLEEVKRRLIEEPLLEKMIAKDIPVLEEISDDV